MRPSGEFTIRRASFVGFIYFVVEHFQYRYVSAHNYLLSYDTLPERKVDLAIPCLVDYDFWLAKGKGTPTSIPEQVAVMEEIAVLTAGRVHCFVPFDPFRQVAFDKGEWRDFSPIELVQEAVRERGAIGCLRGAGVSVWCSDFPALRAKFPVRSVCFGAS